MIQTFTLRQKVRQLFIILLPILITQITLFAMNFFDTTMSGHASKEDLAGVAIGSSIWVPVNTGLTGILLAVTPIVAQLIGARKNEQIPFKVIQAIYLSLAISAVVILGGAIGLDPLLAGMELEFEVQQVAKHYLIAIAYGIVPLFVYTVLRSFIDAHGFTRITMMITLFSLPVNIFFNYVLIFGKMGLPRLGGVGAGYASAITYWVILLITLYFIGRKGPLSELHIFQRWFKLSLNAWKELLRTGIPIGFAIFFETAIFAGVTLLMSQYNTITIAAHQAAMNFLSFLYMIPLSISMGLTILIGFEVGAKRYQDARQYSFLGLGMAIALAVLCSVGLLIFSEQVAGFYTADEAVLALAQQFLVYVMFFQFSDAVGAPIQGALRGYKDVNFPLIMALISYWVVGLPLGYVLAAFTALEAFGYWIGLITGVCIGAIGLLLRLVRIQRKRAASANPA